MGWASGSGLFDQIISALNDTNLNHKERKEVYKAIIPAFEDFDWDTQDECMGADEAFDEAIYELHPEYLPEELEEIEE